jgi:hypothetical protein
MLKLASLITCREEKSREKRREERSGAANLTYYYI